MSSDILGIGISALLANRTALDVAGHNIANVNTTGYSRQRVDFSNRTAGVSSAGFSGAGVQVSSVQRLTNGFIFTREITNTSSLARVQTFNTEAARADTLLSDSSTGLGTPLNGFFDGLATLAANPTSSATRQSVLTSASSLTSRFQDLQNQLDFDSRSVNSQLSQTVDEINGFARSISQINNRIAQAIGSSNGAAPNDLLDQRDQLVRDLSQRVSVNAVPQADGSLNVFVANGQSLVVGTTVTPLGVTRNEFDATRLEVTSGGNTGPIISNQLGGGAIGGLLDTRREILDPAREKLGRLAVALSEAVNAQQAQGVDQAGNFGGPLFQPLSGVAFASVKNAGTGTVDVGFADPSQLNGKEYLLTYDGAAYSLTDSTTGVPVPFTGTGTAADPFLANGLSLTVSGAPVAGDRFQIQPSRSAAGQLRVAITDPSKLAAAAPIRANASVANLGNGTITPGEVVDVTDPNLQTPTAIQFTSATTYSVNGAGSFTYTAGSPITLNGFEVTIAGNPAVGDSFNVLPTGANSGDDRNAKLLSGIATRTLLDGGLNTITGAHGQLVEQVGAQAQQAQLQADAQSSLLSQVTTERNSFSGVNLDEEAASLVRFQQAYQASAQIIATANNVFDALLAAARG